MNKNVQEDLQISRTFIIIKILGRTNCKFANFREVLQMSNILLFGQLFYIKKKKFLQKFNAAIPNFDEFVIF